MIGLRPHEWPDLVIGIRRIEICSFLRMCGARDLRQAGYVGFVASNDRYEACVRGRIGSNDADARHQLLGTPGAGRTRDGVCAGDAAAVWCLAGQRDASCGEPSGFSSVRRRSRRRARQLMELATRPV